MHVSIGGDSCEVESGRVGGKKDLRWLGGHHMYLCEPLQAVFPLPLQATDKLFDDMNWQIVHSLKAVQVWGTSRSGIEEKLEELLASM